MPGIADTRETVVNETDSSYVHGADTLVGVDKQHTHMQYSQEIKRWRICYNTGSYKNESIKILEIKNIIEFLKKISGFKS